MPLVPLYEWTQTKDEIRLSVHIPGFSKDAIDVFLSDLFVKITAPPTYCLLLDLSYPILLLKSTYHHVLPYVHIILHKDPAGFKASEKSDGDMASCPMLWESLQIPTDITQKEAILERRKGAIERGQMVRQNHLAMREELKKSEARRLAEEHWKWESAQREIIEKRMTEERQAEESMLFEWEDSFKQEISSDFPPPLLPQPAPMTTTRPTTEVLIEFSPKILTAPMRTQHEGSYFEKSRYKPASIEDNPMFWKSKADKLANAGRDWTGAIEAYSQAIKRDGCFLAAIANRAACFLRVGSFSDAIRDTNLAISLVMSIPASETTQERYRLWMVKLHTRRGAAYGWNGEYLKSLQDYRMAEAYASAAMNAGDLNIDYDAIKHDLGCIEAIIHQKGIRTEENSTQLALQKASLAYQRGLYEDAMTNYEKVLRSASHGHDSSERAMTTSSEQEEGGVRNKEPPQMDSHLFITIKLNQTAVCLQLGECEKGLELAQFVIQALTGTGVPSLPGEGGNEISLDAFHERNALEDLTDSDDEIEGETIKEDEEEEELLISPALADSTTTPLSPPTTFLSKSKRRMVSKKIERQSEQVYLLLKAYVRAAAALCGLQRFQEAHYFMEQAVAITPFDDDLRNDAMRIHEQWRMSSLINIHKETNTPKETPSAS